MTESANRSPERAAWIEIAFRADVVRRSLRIAAIVGTILVTINYADRAFAGTLGPADWAKMVITYCVPYSVATYAAVQAIRADRGA